MFLPPPDVNAERRILLSEFSAKVERLFAECKKDNFEMAGQTNRKNIHTIRLQIKESGTYRSEQHNRIY